MSRKTSKAAPAATGELTNCRCHSCRGSGWADNTKKIFCKVCDGLGRVARPVSETVPCATCLGLDAYEKRIRPCADCCGTSRIGKPGVPYQTPVLFPPVESRLASLESRLARIETMLFP